jgi:hypothetical protein
MQIRAARGFFAWDRRDLAKNSVVTLYTIERLETGAEISGAAMTKGLAAVDIREPCGGEARFSWVIDNNRHLSMPNGGADPCRHCERMVIANEGGGRSTRP